MKKLNFGAGNDPREGYDNVDEVDFDFDIFPYPIQDETYDYIFMKDVLEHLDYPWKVLKELHRILKPNGTIEIICPHHNDESAYNSLQHKHYFNEQAFKEFLDHCPIFEIESLEVEPTGLGMFIPEFIRNYVARYVGHLKGKMTCVYKKPFQNASKEEEC